MTRLFSTARDIVQRKDFVVLLACNILLGLAYSFVMPFLSIFGTKEVGMSPARFGAFMTITSLSGVVLSTILSRLSDTTWARKTILLIGGGGGALGYLAYAYLREFWSLVAAGSLLLGFASVTFGQVFAYARDLLARSDVPPDQVPLYMNVFRVFFALSWTVGPALAAGLMIHYSFLGTFLVASLLYALFFLTVVFLVPRLPASQKAREAAMQLSLKTALQVPGLVAHFTGFCLYFIASTMGMMNLPLLIINSMGKTSVEVGWAYSIAPVFELPFMLYVGILATRLSHATLIRAALVLSAIYYGALAVVAAPAQVYLLQILSAAIVAVMSGVAITFFQNLLPNQAGTATNLYVNAARIGSTIGYLSFGYLTTSHGHRAVFSVCAVCTALSWLILSSASSRKRAPGEA